jgi:5-methylcytosine-specific restriction endonuclease McrA
MKPHAPGAFALRLVIGQRTHDRLRYAQELLSHRNPSGDLAEAIDQLLDIAIPALEKRKFAATTKPRRGPRRASADPRHIPAHVRNAVWERDGGQCTFVGESGHRCAERRIVEFDHAVPVARGGQATVENVRLRCRVHNQLEAERTFGAGFMDAKREEARRAAEAKQHARAEAARAASEQAAEQARALEEQAKDMICGLRNLGFRADQARRAAESTAMMTSATLEERIRAALKILCPKRSNEATARSSRAVAREARSSSAAC